MSRNEQKILIVDDDPIVLKSLHDLLTIRGYNPNTAIGGQEAICQLDQYSYDLVLLDLHMPYINGHEVMAHIRANQINTSVLMVEQNVMEALKIATYGYVLLLGNLDKAGTPEELLEDEEIRTSYLGEGKYIDRKELWRGRASIKK